MFLLSSYFYVLYIGNGLYRAVSKACQKRWAASKALLCASLMSHREEKHTNLRQKVASEIAENQIWYDKDSPGFASELASDSRILLANYSHYTENTSTDGTWSDINHMYALSAVIGLPIESYFPSTNRNNNPFQRLIKGRGVTKKKIRVQVESRIFFRFLNKTNNDPIKIMWTSTTLPSPLKIGNLRIDHFVPLIKRDDFRWYKNRFQLGIHFSYPATISFYR